ncbi:hypothetical protein V9T40_006303 [Parthenolecanium corni]|uniref:Uncharacterized protein n=1 Tax=Parthenolecanium corni TaxID=536013 RepID=A0AAN9Y7A0_9HEMI
MRIRLTYTIAIANTSQISNTFAIGNETYNIPNLNPLKMTEFNIKQGNKQIGLNMAMHSVDIYGIGTMEITHLELDMDAKTMNSRSVFRRLEIVGLHKSVGSIMVVKVSGEGKFNITAASTESYERERQREREREREREKERKKGNENQVVTFGTYRRRRKNENIVIANNSKNDGNMRGYDCVLGCLMNKRMLRCTVGQAENIDYTYNTTFDYVKRENGYEFAAINGHDMKVNTIGRVYFNLEGMLGDGKLDGAVNDMLNQYWRELSADLFNEVKQEMLTILKAVLDGILRVFPISLVVLD